MIKNILKGAGKFILVFVFLGEPFAACVWAVCGAFASGEPVAAWFFAAIGTSFGIGLFLAVLKSAGRRVPAAARLYNRLVGIREEPQSARFVPHWHMTAMIVALGAVVLFIVGRAILKML